MTAHTYSKVDNYRLDLLDSLDFRDTDLRMARNNLFTN